ncbi:hypothetical protein [Halomonas sp. ML-15]|uniref:hypothetical protein n=1 Tax=Halomonas sp. ML-15 TaxID=2773305 RepID=UPI0017467BDB|nr:hypothetical protein [Halomonas sp. ML-15]
MSALFENILTTLRWSISIGNKLFRVVPGATLTIVIATLVSQLSILLAFLLPLKVIMLLGSTGIPRYFPSSFADFDRDPLVIALSLTAVAFYLLYLLAEKVIAYSSNRGTDYLLKKSQKMTLFENQEEVASRGYQRYSRSLASSIFIFLVAVGLSWLYLDLLIVLIGYIICAFLVLAVLYSLKGKVKAGLDESPGAMVSTATNVGFLLAFGFMVAQFLLGEPPGLLVAIISLILMRQGFSRITGLVNDLKGLYSQRLKLNALFFHGHVLITETNKNENNFWTLLQSSQRGRWVCDAIANASSLSVEKAEMEWVQMGGQDVATFRVKVFYGNENSEFLLKLFNKNRSSLAKHEAVLLLGNNVLPSLPLLGVENVEGFHCHVFEWIPAIKIPHKQANLCKKKMMKLLMVVEPGKALISQFNRSRPPIWQRIDSRMLERMRTVAELLDDESVNDVENFKKIKSAIMKRLQALPLSLVNPELGPNAFIKTDAGDLLLAHWGRWCLEPVGANWPVQNKELEHLVTALNEARSLRGTLRSVSDEDACLSALVFALEKLCLRQDYISALKLIPRILEYLESETQTFNCISA